MKLAWSISCFQVKKSLKLSANEYFRLHTMFCFLFDHKQLNLKNSNFHTPRCSHLCFNFLFSIPQKPQEGKHIYVKKSENLDIGQKAICKTFPHPLPLEFKVENRLRWKVMCMSSINLWSAANSHVCLVIISVRLHIDDACELILT